MIENGKATIDPAGGVIVRLVRGEADRALTLRSNGSETPLTREAIGPHLLVVKLRPGTRRLEHVRGSVVTSLRVAATRPLAAPSLVRVTSTARRNTPHTKLALPVSEVAVSLGADMPATAYTLVIYKVDRDGARGIMDGKPTKRVIAYRTGGKQCGYGGREQVFPGEQIAVAWLDIHGRLSPRSQPVTVGVGVRRN